jgi:hypothetical protein
MTNLLKMRYALHLKNFGRLKLTLTIAMLGFMADTLMSSWMLSSDKGYYESNMTLYPQMGIPLMVINYIVADYFVPRTTFFNNIFYSLSVLQWSGPMQNMLVLLKITPGIDFFYALPVILIASFAVLNFGVNRDDTRARLQAKKL